MRNLPSARLVELEQLSEDVRLFTFEADEDPFVGCEAGAHVDVHLPNGLIRNYSLVHWTPDGRRLSVAVKREPAGRGGSLAMHDLEFGCVIRLSGPRNNFRVRAGAGPVVLIGGGIGITPLYAMARALQASGRTFDVYYMVRSREMAAFDARLRTSGLGERYHLHCDDTDGLPDLRALLARYPGETHYYVCGPEVLLTSMLEASGELALGTVFFERFSAAPHAAAGARDSFVIAVNSTGEEFKVPADKSILQVLRDAGHDVDYACSEGACGTCITYVLEGEIDHRDSILTDEEKDAGDCMCVCVSRASSPRLLLDL